MNTTKKLPVNYIEFEGEEIMCNLDHSITQSTVEAIKDKELFSRYAGWNFNGKVWYEEDLWHCEVWVYGTHNTSYSCESLEDIMTEVSDEYGYD